MSIHTLPRFRGKKIEIAAETAEKPRFYPPKNPKTAQNPEMAKKLKDRFGAYLKIVLSSTTPLNALHARVVHDGVTLFASSCGSSTPSLL